jgi:glycosyltransferase involved in cell wall biosynthesis
VKFTGHHSRTFSSSKCTPGHQGGTQTRYSGGHEIRAFWEDAAVDHGTTNEGSLRYRATRKLETRAIQQVDHVFTICEGLRADIVGRGVAAEKVTVIPNAVDIASFKLASPRPGTTKTMGPDRKNSHRLYRILLRLRRSRSAAQRPACHH